MFKTIEEAKKTIKQFPPGTLVSVKNELQGIVPYLWKSEERKRFSSDEIYLIIRTSMEYSHKLWSGRVVLYLLDSTNVWQGYFSDSLDKILVKYPHALSCE